MKRKRKRKRRERGDKEHIKRKRSAAARQKGTVTVGRPVAARGVLARRGQRGQRLRRGEHALAYSYSRDVGLQLQSKFCPTAAVGILHRGLRLQAGTDRHRGELPEAVE